MKRNLKKVYVMPSFESMITYGWMVMTREGWTDPWVKSRRGKREERIAQHCFFFLVLQML